MPKPKILVTGANGQLGKAFRALAEREPRYAFLFLSREDLPLERFERLRTVFQTERPDWCVNCAAYTAVDLAESEKDRAWLVNAEAPGVLAAVCRETGTKLFHISTDYVFDGTKHMPYIETDPTAPLNVYGASKRAGELQVLAQDPGAVIIRTSWVYSAFGKNFVTTMLRLMKERDRIQVVSDQWGSPTYAVDLAKAILYIIATGTWIPGIFHYSNDGAITWFRFAEAIRDLSGSVCVVDPIPTSSYPTPAKRPAYGVMLTDKVREAYGVAVRPWEEALSECLERMGEKK
jgi:dTDP-4-dehydrorhamnose reductase